MKEKKGDISLSDILSPSFFLIPNLFSFLIVVL